MLAFFGKSVRHIDELPPAVGQAVGEDRLQFLRDVPRKSIAHLDRRGQFRRTPHQHVLEVLPGMLASAEEQHDFIALPPWPRSPR